MQTAIFRLYDSNGRFVTGSRVIEREWETREELDSLKAELQPEGYEYEGSVSVED